MGRAPCCDKANVKKGPWSPEEDQRLKSYIEKHGTGGNWIALPQKIGLKRCGKSCRLRWLNYLRPNLKHGGFSDEEDNIICSLYVAIGSRWSIIAAHLPGRTDNDIKNHWNTKLKTRLLGKQRKNHQNRRFCNLKQLTMKNKADHNQSLISAANYEATNINAWLNHPIHSITDHNNQSQVSISKLQMKLPCCGNGPHQVQVAPSLKIPQAIYEAPMFYSAQYYENTLGPEYFEANTNSYYNSLMKLEGFDFFYGMGSLINESEMNSFTLPVLPIESTYEETLDFTEQC